MEHWVGVLLLGIFLVLFPTFDYSTPTNRDCIYWRRVDASISWQQQYTLHCLSPSHHHRTDRLGGAEAEAGATTGFLHIIGLYTPTVQHLIPPTRFPLIRAPLSLPMTFSWSTLFNAFFFYTHSLFLFFLKVLFVQNIFYAFLYFPFYCLYIFISVKTILKAIKGSWAVHAFSRSYLHGRILRADSETEKVLAAPFSCKKKED